DPRLIEVIGWLAYLVPVALYVYWPQSRRPQPRTTMRLKTGIAATAAVIAIVLAAAYPRPQLDLPTQAGLVTEAGSSAAQAGTARFSAGPGDQPATLNVALSSADSFTLKLPANQREQDRHHGVDANVWTIRNTSTPADAPTTLTLTQVVALAGGRIRVGLSPQQQPGPFEASWSVHHATRMWATHGVLLDAIGRGAATV